MLPTIAARMSIRLMRLKSSFRHSVARETVPSEASRNTGETSAISSAVLAPNTGRHSSGTSASTIRLRIRPPSRLISIAT